MNLKIESYRKFFHFLLISIPIIFVVFGRPTTILILAPITLFVVSLDYLRRQAPVINIIFNKIFGIILREHEKQGGELSGASYVFLAATINFLIFKSEIAVAGFLILVISDALAALVGKAIPSRSFFEKSSAGSLAFFISALVIMISCGIYFDVKFNFYIFGLFAVFCVTAIEARPTLIGIDDNFMIPMVFAVEMSFFDLLWNYSY